MKIRYPIRDEDGKEFRPMDEIMQLIDAEAYGTWLLFDSVQTVEDTAEWKVSAGTPVGFMGCEEYPGRESTQAEREWFVHLEVLSADPRMPAFLGNPEGVKGGKNGRFWCKKPV
ncbi:hypothetical protein NLN82_27520 [Citrobacter portucalensis]|uniref:hypothetical protein n=1 Tax=Citrobacter portucalensis TaxID=1639133 RepID=UPI00226B75EC|nr:hypothetical protein [Citrobacter portucalensis]MCX8971872.1 hypothetical protein [Citrobacter portucalensis]MCX9039744.1 hypothetical protein [Citrobacter portucalensis]